MLWEFEVLGLIVDARALKATEARDLAKKIALTNKRIGGAVLARFIAKLGLKE